MHCAQSESAQHGLRKLEKQHAKLVKRLMKLEQQMSTYGGAAGGRGRRARNKQSLVEVLAQVLKGKTLGVPEGRGCGDGDRLHEQRGQLPSDRQPGADQERPVQKRSPAGSTRRSEARFSPGLMLPIAVIRLLDGLRRGIETGNGPYKHVGDRPALWGGPVGPAERLE